MARLNGSEEFANYLTGHLAAEFLFQFARDSLGGRVSKCVVLSAKGLGSTQ